MVSYFTANSCSQSHGRPSASSPSLSERRKNTRPDCSIVTHMSEPLLDGQWCHSVRWRIQEQSGYDGEETAQNLECVEVWRHIQVEVSIYSWVYGSEAQGRDLGWR